MLSLNDISIIAVFRLPITLDNIDSFGPGLTFASLLQGHAAAVALSLEEVQVEQGYLEAAASRTTATACTATTLHGSGGELVVTQEHASSSSGYRRKAPLAKPTALDKANPAVAAKAADGELLLANGKRVVGIM